MHSAWEIVKEKWERAGGLGERCISLRIEGRRSESATAKMKLTPCRVAGCTSGGEDKAQPAPAEITAACGPHFLAHLTRLLGGQIADKRDLIILVAVGLIHQENPIGEDRQHD